MADLNKIAPRRSYMGPMLLVGGGLAVGGIVMYAMRRSQQTTNAIQNAIAGTAPPAEPAILPSPDAPQLQPAVEAGTGGYVKLRLTGYWPFTARADEKQMEGGVFDRKMPSAYKNQPNSQQYKDHVLHTVEQHLADPVNVPFVSLSGDYTIWPYGQKVIIPWANGRTVIGRVVDTGSHFFGAGKIYRVAGEEPIDVCVNSSETVVPKNVTAQIVPGDNFEHGRAVAAGGFKGQSISGDIVEGRLTQDHEALARALESELGSRTKDEQIAAAWVIRNRADHNGVSIGDLLAPSGNYGSPRKSKGYASTRKVATDKSRAIADEVLGADSWDDPTDGALDFWVPEQQSKLNQLGDVHRAAAASGDQVKAKKYERYADYGSEGDVRLQQVADGLRVLRVVGIIELLGRI